MSKTWKDLPQNVEGAVKRKKPVRPKPEDPTEAEVLSEEEYWKEKEREYRGDWW